MFQVAAATLQIGEFKASTQKVLQTPNEANLSLNPRCYNAVATLRNVLQ
jgi:hypothetical protein